jgi:nucleoside-diphosphate-sugar epimerase
VAARLLDSLTVDDQRIRHALDWASPFTMADGLSEMAAWFRSSIR